MEYMRLFWAVNLPGELKRYLFEQVCRPLRSFPPGLKWVREENIHLTVKFLGDVKAGQVKEIAGSVKRAVGDFGVISLIVKDLGCFPSAKKARVFWAGLDGEVEKLTALRDKLEEALVSPGFEAEKRHFLPHITLARFHSSGNGTGLIREAGEFLPRDRELGSFSVDSLELMQSTLSGKGPTYKILERVSLQ